jgi:hypothetical protein
VLFSTIQPLVLRLTLLSSRRDSPLGAFLYPAIIGVNLLQNSIAMPEPRKVCGGLIDDAVCCFEF